MSELNILIIEDEKPASDKLIKLLNQYNSGFNILAVLVSIQDSVDFLRANLKSIDIIFLDIQLTDGPSFSIFEQIEIKKPVIFTTAFNEYALEAFKHNSIDYILKPYLFEDIKNALDKFTSLKQILAGDTSNFDYEILKKLMVEKPQYKTRFMVRKGEKIKALETDSIKLFYADDRDVYLLSNDNRRFSVNQKLEEIDKTLDPLKFFRVNRTFIVQFNAINEVIAYSNSRLKLDVDFKWDREIIVSREKVSEFKKWMAGE